MGEARKIVGWNLRRARVARGYSIEELAGEVYLFHHCVSEKPVILQNKKSVKLSAAGYRFLIHLLKHNGNGGISLEVAKAVWPYDGIFIQNLEEAWAEHNSRSNKSRNPFKGLDGRIKKEKTLLRALLDGFSIELTVDEMRELSHHVLEKMPRFCLIHIRADRD